jgi:hypothetical protein
MNIFFNPSSKEKLLALNEVFQKKGVPALINQGFIKSPFTASFYGKNNIGSFTYDHCRLSSNSELHCLTTYLSKGSSWVQTFLNVFQLNPCITDISNLVGLNGIQFRLPPNTISRMRLKIDGYRLIPLFRDMYVKQHKLGNYYTKKGFENRLLELGKLLEKDLNNIDYFVKQWHEIHKPLLTDWEGWTANPSSAGVFENRGRC